MKKLFTLFAAAMACTSMMAQDACNTMLVNKPEKVSSVENNNMYVIEWENPTGDLVNPNVSFSFWYQTTFMASRSLYVDYKTTTADWTQLGTKIASDGNGRTINDRKLPADATGLRFRYQGGVVGSCSFASVTVPMNSYMNLDNAPDSLLGNVDVNQAWTSAAVAVRHCDVQAIVAEITDFVSVNEVHQASCLTAAAFDEEVTEACGTYGSVSYQVTGSFVAADTIKANLSLTTPCGKVQVVPVCVVVASKTPTALPEQKEAVKAAKVLRNGQLLIRREETLFDLNGRRVK